MKRTNLYYGLVIFHILEATAPVDHGRFYEKTPGYPFTGIFKYYLATGIGGGIEKHKWNYQWNYDTFLL